MTEGRQPTVHELALRDLAGQLAAEKAAHAVTRAQRIVDRRELDAIKADLANLKEKPAKPRRKR